MKRSLFTLAVSVFASVVAAQSTPHDCSTDHVFHEMVQADPSILHNRAALEAEIQEYLLNNPHLRDEQQEITIPLVFHVLHLKGLENISNEQILTAVDLLNRDFAKLNPDTTVVLPMFQDRIGRSNIRFALATIDQYGNCTNGIERIETVQTLYGESFSKTNQWPRAKYMNIWVSRILIGGAAAYALYPGSTEGFAQLWDGIMSLHNYVGSIGTGGTGNSSRTLTHEMGHSMNLSHVWGDTNDPNVACGDDGVLDTPQTRGFQNCNTQLINAARCDRLLFEPHWTTFTFDDVTTSSGTVDPTPVPVVLDTITDVMRTSFEPISAHGVSANSVVNGQFAFSNWPDGALDGNTVYAELTGQRDDQKYYRIVVFPAATDVLKVDTVIVKVSRSADGPRTFALRTGVNNFGSNLPFVTNSFGIINSQSPSVAYFMNDVETSGTVRFVTSGTNTLQPAVYHLYAWNSEAESGSFHVEEVIVRGETAAIENFQNYMDYSGCNIMFTHGQIDRMYAALNSASGQRNMLWTPENLAATGVAPGTEVYCAPEADFYAVVGSSVTNPTVPFNAMSCTNSDVRFMDNSSRAFVTGWNWTFQDGSPATSTERNPVVQFTSPGWKSVTLTASNDQGSSTRTNEYAVFINGDGQNMPAPLMKNFESGVLHPFRGDNHDGNHTSWTVVTGTASQGNRSARLNSGERNLLNVINPDNYGDVDDLVSPVMDLSGLSSTGGQLSFDYHYATYASDTSQLQERMEIRYSTNCGRTWTAFSPAQMTVIDLVTNGNSGNPGNWRTRSINLPQSALADNVAFRFRFTSSPWSGDLYIDNIYVGGPVGINELGPEQTVNLFPNPTEGGFTLQVLGLQDHATTVMIQDLSGATVYTNVFAPRGGQGLQLDARELGLANGMYMLHATNAVGSGTTKLVLGR